MAVLVAAVVLVGALVTLDLVLTFAVNLFARWVIARRAEFSGAN